MRANEIAELALMALWAAFTVGVFALWAWEDVFRGGRRGGRGE